MPDTASYTRWSEYLKSARNGHDRPINGSTTKRVLWGPNGSIILRLHYTDVVTLHADGTETIDTGGWHTHQTMQFIAEHSRARVWSDKCQLFVRTNEPTFTAPRVSKCRRCKGGQVKQECYGPGWCYADYGYPCEHGETSVHRRPECFHGKTEAHALPSVDCWQCHGEGRYDYGSKPVHYQWYGEPLAIDCDGYPIGPVIKVEYHPVSKSHVSASKSYSNSGDLLSSVLPALATEVNCPHCSTSRSLEALVIHLNDSAKWTRERVADWLDTLDVDLSFPVPDFIPAHIT